LGVDTSPSPHDVQFSTTSAVFQNEPAGQSAAAQESKTLLLVRLTLQIAGETLHTVPASLWSPAQLQQEQLLTPVCCITLLKA
jgi:hypothetical protein